MRHLSPPLPIAAIFRRLGSVGSLLALGLTLAMASTMVGCADDEPPAGAEGEGEGTDEEPPNEGGDEGTSDFVPPSEGEGEGEAEGPPAGAECTPGDVRVCGSDVGVCERAEQICENGSWQPCPGQVAMGREICDDEDNDCNGRIDDGLGVGDPCEAGVGVCRREGRYECDLETGQAKCDVEAGQPTDVSAICLAMDLDADCGDICNGLDDDCDGSPDEHITLGTACIVGVGGCGVRGVTVCAEDGTIGCSAVPTKPLEELCGDGIDNDCDEETDEGFGMGEECDDFRDGCRLPGRTLCNEDQTETFCQVTPEHYPQEGPIAFTCAPVDVRVYPCGGQLDVVWTPVPWASGYTVNFGIPDGPNHANAFGGQSPRAVAGEAAAILGLQDGQDYRIQVRADFVGSPGKNSDRFVVRPAASRGEVIQTEDELVVPEGAIVTLHGDLEFAERVVIDGVVCVTPLSLGDLTRGSLRLTAPTIEVNGAIVASARGSQGGVAAGPGAHSNGGGGGHGGAGGNGGGNCAAAGGISWGRLDSATATMGSGGGGLRNGGGNGAGGAPPLRCSEGSAGGGGGGGAINLRASEEIVIRGDLVTNGGHGERGSGRTFGGGGAGGGVVMDSPNTKVIGRVLASGGDGGGGGGGGRVKIFGLRLNTGRIASPAGLGLEGGAPGDEGSVHLDINRPD